MTWRGPRKSGKDPLLPVQATTNGTGNTGSGCACRVLYVAERSIMTGPNIINGRQNLRSLVVGHRVSRYHAKLADWSPDMINSIGNSQPECRECSNLSGARLGRQVQRSSRRVRIGLDDSARW